MKHGPIITRSVSLNRTQIKRWAALLAVSAGLYLIIFAIHSMQKLTEAKGVIHDVSNFFNKDPFWNPLITFFGGKAREHVSQYDLPVMLCLIGGIGLVVVGTVVFLLTLKGKSKNPLQK